MAGSSQSKNITKKACLHLLAWSGSARHTEQSLLMQMCCQALLALPCDAHLAEAACWTNHSEWGLHAVLILYSSAEPG